ncbi:hypothetical protein [Streptococcus parauberis]|uniref:hypothetical protein n=1 Tax=Streptococcus parauberis TaxID=1348 RepID=UPI000E3013A2|nr:hypothetical protein [Streptococcus parauberis]RFE01095.1 hypothetical protein ADO06_01969 [Streptococcus parauberis]
MTIIELSNCNITNFYNSFTDAYYDPDYYGCPTCGGAEVPDTFELTVVTDNFGERVKEFYGKDAKNAVKNFLPWVLKNKDSFKKVTFYEFMNDKLEEIANDD